jgi:Fe-S oxidoreductase
MVAVWPRNEVTCPARVPERIEGDYWSCARPLIPCYADMFYPHVGVATLELLEKLGVQVDYPIDQTCCGQPMANSGAHTELKTTEELCVRNFADHDYVVAPSGSCVHHIRNKFTRGTHHSVGG